MSTLLLSYVVQVKSEVEISQNFVAFSEYMNFTKGNFLLPFCLNENDVGSCLARAEAAAAECSLLLFSHPVSWGYYKIPVCW